MHLWGRKKELHIYGPKGLAEIITVQFKYSETIINFDLNVTEVDSEVHALIVDHPNYTVHTIPLKHRIKCCGFLVREKPKSRRLIHDRLPEYLTPLQKLALKKGENINDDKGEIILNEFLTENPKKSLSFAYCSDTAYLETILPIIQNVDLLFHEATFDSSMSERATQTFHSTAAQAATVALKASVGTLIIGHFSSRYRELDVLLEEAKAIFPATQLAEEGKSYTINAH